MADKTTGMIDGILSKVEAAMAADPDVRHATGPVTAHMRRLLGACEVTRLGEGDGADEYTVRLVEAYVGFVAAPWSEVYGSNADYCASNALRAIAGHRIRLRERADADGILHEVRVGIHTTALEPRHSFWVLSKAGVPISRKKFLVRS